MIVSEQPSHINNEILFRSVYAADDELPEAATLISQGVAVGALLSLLSPVGSMILHAQEGFNFLYLPLLPLYLFAGMLFGAFQGVIIWACTLIDGHPLSVFVRSCISLGVLALFLAT